MHPVKRVIAADIIRHIFTVCSHVTSEKSPDKAFSLVLGINCVQLEDLITKILIALPDEIFYLSNQSVLNKIKLYISHEFIFFEAQEDFKDINYLTNLLGFIDSLVNHINDHVKGG